MNIRKIRGVRSACSSAIPEMASKPKPCTSPGEPPVYLREKEMQPLDTYRRGGDFRMHTRHQKNIGRKAPDITCWNLSAANYK